jgi:large subunit ribosomal protein L5
MNRLKEKYNKEIISILEEKFGLKNRMAVPKIDKVTINVGISANKKDEKYLEMVKNTLTRISGQKPVMTKAKNAISAFKIREGNVVGSKVTLRGDRMYDFVDKLINVAFPRVRDFRGVKTSVVDKLGNLSVGFKENLIFGEINSDEVDAVHGLEVTITTTAKTKEEGIELFKAMNFPFIKDKKNK